MVASKGFPVELQALPYSNQSISSLTSGQAAGTSPIIAANASRKALQFSAAVNFQLALSASQTFGMRIYARASHSLIGAECPDGALYLVSGSGLNAGDTLTIWEA